MSSEDESGYDENCELIYDDYTFIEMYMKKREKRRMLASNDCDGRNGGDIGFYPPWEVYLKSLIERFNEVEKMLRISPRSIEVDRATQRRFNIYVEDSIIRL